MVWVWRLAIVRFRAVVQSHERTWETRALDMQDLPVCAVAVVVAAVAAEVVVVVVVVAAEAAEAAVAAAAAVVVVNHPPDF